VPYRKRILWLLLFLAPVVYQLWLSPFTGLADNGDFAKVAGRFALKPFDPGPQATFHYFQRVWQVDPAALWVSPYWGIEVWLTQVARWLQPGPLFDLRTMGLIHLLIFAVGAWLMTTGKAAGILFAILAFTDAAYVTYFQSFYFDAASLVFLLLLFAAWRADHALLLAIGGAGFALSKGPHAPLAILLALVLLTERKKQYLPAVALLLAGGVYMLSQTKDEYKATAYYNLAFFKLGLLDPGALDALKIRPEDRKLVGTHAFMPESPAQNEAWLKHFLPQGGYSNALVYYAKSPLILARVLWGDLTNEAQQIRAVNLGNYERSTDKPYCTRSTMFGWYSGFKEWLFRVAPWHVLLLFPFCMWLVGNRPLLWGVAITAGYEFGIASLADACETYRHLLLFHVAYDLLVLLAISTTFDMHLKRTSSL
jgi:hypothetical protein